MPREYMLALKWFLGPFFLDWTAGTIYSLAPTSELAIY